MSDRLKHLIISELAGLNYFPIGDKRIKIHCPYHNDHNPSLIIPLNHHKYRPGQFKCFSCGAKGGWNDLAERLKLKKWNEEDTKKFYDKSSGKDFEDDDAFKDLLPSLNATGISNEPRELDGTEEFPEGFTWRGLDKDFWEQYDCSYYWDRRKDQFYIHMPLTMNGKYMGYTLAAIDPQPNIPKYQTFAPTDSVILMYDHIDPRSTIVLVEGHFDAWRMHYYGFNAGGMIGTENWSDKKTNAILAKLPKRIIVCTDGDEPGYKAGEMLVNTFLKYGIDVVFYKLPFYPKPDSLDPGNMSLAYIEDMRRYIL